jgi:hypothetical protein
MKRARRGVVVSVALALGLGLALGGTAGAASTPSARDRAILTAGVIRRSDVPPGWVSHKQASGSANRFQGIAECKDVAPTLNAALRTVPHRVSAEFSDPTSGTQTTLAANTVFAFKDMAAAARYVATYRRPSIPGCFTKSLQRAVGSSLQGAQSTIAVTPLSNLAGLGDDEVGYSVALTVSAPGAPSETLYDDIVTVRVGRAVLDFTFQNLDAELAVGPPVIRQVSSRVAPLAT